MRNKLLICILALTSFAVVFGHGGTKPPAGFPSIAQLSEWLETKSSSEVYENLVASIGADELSGNALRAFLNVLNDIERCPQPQTRRENVEVCRAWLMAVHGYDAAALAIVKRLIDDPLPIPLKRLADLALIEATIELRAGNRAAAASAAARLEALDHVAGQALRARLSSFSYERPPVIRISKLLTVVLWLFILCFPYALMEWRCRRWLEKFPPGRDRKAPYNALRNASTNLLSATFGALLVFILDFPALLGISYKFTSLFLHWFISYSVSLIPLYKLDSEVRQTSWSFAEFLKTVMRLHLLKALPLVAPLTAFFVIRAMAISLPWWCIYSPWKPALGFAAFCAAMLLILPLAIPALMGMKRLSAKELPRNICEAPVAFYRWNLRGGKIANAISFGYLRSTYSMAFTDRLLEDFTADEIAAVAAHEEAHLVKEDLFIYFLVMVNMALAAGCWSVLYETSAERMLIFGPDFTQASAIIILGAVAERIFMLLGRRFEYEADAFAASKVGREPYIEVLARLNDANFMPVRVREGEGTPGLHPSFAERRRALRARDGKIFEPQFDTAPKELILALWRSRLAFEWTRGEREAMRLCALDDDLQMNSPLCDRLEKLAERHAAFGSYALLYSETSRLDILECAQKLAVKKAAEAQIPSDRVCALCHGAMLEILSSDSKLCWKETSSGCRLEKRIAEL